MLRIGKEKCPYCFRSDVYVSDPKSLWEEFAVLLLLRPCFVTESLPTPIPL